MLCRHLPHTHGKSCLNFMLTSRNIHEFVIYQFVSTKKYGQKYYENSVLAESLITFKPH